MFLRNHVYKNKSLKFTRSPALINPCISFWMEGSMEFNRAKWSCICFQSHAVQQHNKWFRSQSQHFTGNDRSLLVVSTMCWHVCSCTCVSVSVRAGSAYRMWRSGWDSGDSPHQPQRDRDPADVSGTQQVTDVVSLPPLRMKIFLWGGKAIHLEISSLGDAC